MQKRGIKQELSAAFATPKPRKKELFLQQYPAPAISNLTLLIRQIRYMRWTIVLLSGMVFAIVLLCSFSANPTLLWMGAAASPFIALSVLTARCRSYRHGMEELEFSTRFSLKSVMLARLAALAGLHAVLLLVLLMVLGSRGFHLLRSGLYLLLPYCTTISIALPLTRKFHGEKLPRLCVTIALTVSGMVWLLHPYAVQLTVVCGLLVLAIEAMIIIAESVTFIRQTEELSWNYS